MKRKRAGDLHPLNSKAKLPRGREIETVGPLSGAWFKGGTVIRTFGHIFVDRRSWECKPMSARA